MFLNRDAEYVLKESPVHSLVLYGMKFLSVIMRLRIKVSLARKSCTLERTHLLNSPKPDIYTS